MTRNIKTVFEILENLKGFGSYGSRIWTSCELKEENITIDQKPLTNQPINGKFDLLILGYYEYKTKVNEKWPTRIYHPRENILLISNHLKDKYLYCFLENLYNNITEILEYKKTSEQKIKSYKKILKEVAPNCKYIVCERCGYDYNKEKRLCPICNYR